jgi:alpha-tubulin suppressor-like RCC1 family protein
LEPRDEVPQDAFQWLPDEMALHICSFLDSRSLVSLSGVNWGWQNLTSDVTLKHKIDDLKKMPMRLLDGSQYGVLFVQDGRLYTWPKGIYNAPGKNRRPDPVIIQGERIHSVESRSTHTVILTDQGKVYTWGDNFRGQLGYDVLFNRLVPRWVQGELGGKKVISVGAGFIHTVALTDTGEVYEWGGLDRFRMGHEGLMPKKVEGDLLGEHVVSIGTGTRHTVALTDQGKVYTWGNNFYKQLGNDNSRERPTPRVLSGEILEMKVIAISVGSLHSLALTDEGSVYSWGKKEGVDDVPKRVQGLQGKKITSIVAGANHSVALTDAGEVYTWGSNTTGQLGDGTHIQTREPVLVQGKLLGKKIRSVAAGSRFTLALSPEGELFFWGATSVLRSIYPEITEKQLLLPRRIKILESLQ